MSRVAKLVLVLAMVTGSLLGTLMGRFEQAGATTYGYWVYVHPGGTSPDGVNDYLNCGWHGTCLGNANWGTGLDWRNSHGEWVYFRSSSSNNAGYSSTGRAVITDWGGTCRTTYVSLYRWSGIHDSTVAYVHTGSNFHGTTFYPNSGYYPQWTSRTIGNTLTEPSSCDTTGAHLHEQTWNGFNYWVKPTSEYPTMEVCELNCGDKRIFDLYQLGFYWQD